jgi:GTPase-associated protein 1, N-terminal domain type 2/GTPase-associated protein 1, middle domain
MNGRGRGRGGRFGQLTYSSFDSGTGAGGWQVKEVRDLTADEVTHLTSRIATRLDVGPVDPFPTPEQIAGLPRRMVYGLAVSAGWAWWHTAPAGVDGSGRPGNVFAHVVLDRAAEASEDRVRPVDLWRSPDWLTPFNPSQVVAAVLPDVDRPRPASTDARHDAIAFLLDPTCWRLGVLPALLDAVSAALAGGPTVVLGVANADRAAAWVATVSYFTAPATARRLAFSTLERAGGVRTAAGNGLAIVCVPRVDLELVPRDPDLVVIDEDELVQMGAMHAEPHVTAHGSRITVTPWSGLARAVAEDVGVAQLVLAEMDAIAARVASDPSLPAALLALAVLAHGGLDDAREDAATELLEHAPPMDTAPDLAGLVLPAVRDLVGTGPAGAWAHLASSSGAWTPARRLVLDLYVQGALGDPAWLCVSGGVPLPDLDGALPVSVDPEVLDGAVTHLRARAIGADDATAHHLAVEALRMLDLLVRVGAGEVARSDPASPGDNDSSAGRAIRPDLAVELERLVVPQLLDPNRSGALMNAARPLDDRTWRDGLRPLVLAELAASDATERLPLGRRVDAGTLRWLAHPPELPGRDAATAIAWCGAADALEVERLVRAHLDAVAAGTDDPWAMAVLVLAVVGLERGTPTPEEPLEQLAAHAAPTLDDLVALLEALPGLPPSVVLPALKSAPSSFEVDELCLALDPNGWEWSLWRDGTVGGSAVEHLVRLRSAVRRSRWWTWKSDATRGESWPALLYRAAASAASSVLPDVPLAGDIVAHAQAAWVAAAVHTRPHPTGLPGPHKSVSGVALGPDDASTFLRIVEEAVPISQAAAFGAMTTLGSPFADDAQHLWPLASLVVTLDGMSAAVLDHVVRRHLAAGGDPAGLVDEASRIVQAYLRSRTGDHSTEAEVTEAIQSYVKVLFPRQGVRHATLGRFRRG